MPSVRAAGRLLLRLHGVDVLALSQDESVLEELARDFAYFAASGAPGESAPITVALHAGPAPKDLSAGGRWWPGRGLRWRDEAGARLVRYDGGELVRWSPASRRGEIYCERPHRLHELGYLLILSAAGARLDAQGLHRVHALGFERDGAGSLVLLPSGGGKTSLAMALRSAPDLSFLSEDTPLVTGDARLLAFPLRWGLRSKEDAHGIPERFVRPFERRRYGLKWLVDVDYFEGRLRAQAPARWLFIGRRTPGRRASVTPVSALRGVGPLALNLVVGWGVPQMAEYVLSAGAAPKLTRAAIKRAGASLRLLRAARCCAFELGGSPQEAAQALLDFLRRA